MLKPIALTLSALTVGVSIIAARWLGSAPPQADSRSFDQTLAARNVTSVEITVPIGHVTLSADGGERVTVHAVRSTKYPKSEAGKRWLNDSVFSVENHSGRVVVQDQPYGKDRLGDSENHLDATLDVQVHVPAHLDATVSVAAGSADSNGAYRSFNARVAAGNLTADSIQSDAPISLHVGAGKVVDTLSVRSHVDARIDVGAGNVQLVLPTGASADVSAKVAMGDITGLPSSDRRNEDHTGDSRRAKAGAGDAKVNVHVGIGSIKVNSSESLNPVAEDDRVDSSLLAQDLSHPGVAGSSDAAEQDSNDKDMDVQIDGKDLSRIGDVVANAMSKIQPELKKALDQANGEVSKSLADIAPQVLQAVEDAKPDIDKAIADAKQADKHLTVRQKQDIRKALTEARGEIARAMQEARRAVDKAMADVKTEQMTADKGQIEAAVREAMKAAREAIKEAEAAMKDADKKSGN